MDVQCPKAMPVLNLDSRSRNVQEEHKPESLSQFQALGLKSFITVEAGLGFGVPAPTLRLLVQTTDVRASLELRSA